MLSHNRYLVVSVTLLSALAFTPLAATAQQTMDDDAVVKLMKSGMSEDLIVQTISASAGKYDVSVDAMIALKQAGVTDKELGAMVTKNANASASVPSKEALSGAPPTTHSSSPDAIIGQTSKVIPKGATVFIAPMNGYETYFISALDKKQVPVVVVSDETKADFIITGNADSQKAGWAKTIVTGSSQTSEEASINVKNTRTGSVVFAYNVDKSNSFHGKQSTAEACAKHLKDKIDSGK